MEERSAFDRWEESNSYEMMTELEANFLLDLHSVIVDMFVERESLTMKNIARHMRISTTELMDYSAEVTEIISQVDPKYFEDEQ